MHKLGNAFRDIDLVLKNKSRTALFQRGNVNQKLYMCLLSFLFYVRLILIPLSKRQTDSV